MWKKKLYLVIIAALALGSNFAMGDVVTGLEGYWPLDGNAQDFSGNERHGTLIGDAHFIDEGMHGGALELDGDGDFVSMDGYKGIMQSPWTLACWIKTTAAGNLDILSWGTEGGGLKVEFRLDEGRLRVEHGNGNNRGDALVHDGQWHHAVAKLPEGATTVKEVLFFSDGEQLGVFQIGNGDNPFKIAEDKDFNVGRSGPRGDRYFNGLIDDVKLYTRALTKDEIVQAMDPEPESVEAKGKLATRWGMLKAR